MDWNEATCIPWVLSLIFLLTFFFFLSLRDYRVIPALDVYAKDGLDDDADFSDLSEGARQEAEKEMKKRDREEGLASGRMRRGLMYGM